MPETDGNIVAQQLGPGWQGRWSPRLEVLHFTRSITPTIIILVLLAAFSPPLHAQIPTTIGWTPLSATTALTASGACPPNNFEGDPFQFSAACQNVIRAWGGGIADTTANRLIIWGGGHNNYYGNEIYSLNLMANPITMTRLKDPTVPTNYSNSENCVESIPPGTSDFAPNSRESYGGMVFLPVPDVMYILNGSLACGLGNGSVATWTIPLNNISSSSSWVHEDPTLTGPEPGTFIGFGGSSYGNIAAYDPNSGLVFVNDGASIYTYSYQTNTYTLISPVEGFFTGYVYGAIDPTRKLFVFVGGCSEGTCPADNGVLVADISNPASTARQDWTAATMADPNCAEFLNGGVNPIGSGTPGIAFDSVANDFVGWPNQGDSVYIMTPDTVNQRLTCQKLTFANGPPNSAHRSLPNTTNGTFGRFQYFPGPDVFVVVNDGDIPAYILRLRTPSSPNFTLSATPSPVSVSPGGNATYTVSTAALDGFSGTMILSASDLPNGATASFNPPSIPVGASSTLAVTTTASTPAANSTLTITGTSGSLTNSTTVVLSVTDFAVSATPSSTSVNAGGSATYTVSAAALNGFTGTVSLGVTSGLPAGATASFNPTSIAAGANSTLTIATSSSTPVGNPTLTITGTSGSLTHSANVILNIIASASSASAISIDFVGLETTPMASSEVAGVVALGNWNDAAGASRTSPLALVDQNGNPTTATVSWTSDDVWDMSSVEDQAGNLRMMRGYLDNGEMDTTTVTVSGLPTNGNGYNVYIYADGDSNNSGNTGVYQISGAGIATTSATLTYNSDFAGTFTQATASNPVGNYVVLAIPNVASFALSAIPSTASDGFERAPVNGIQIVPVVLLMPDFSISTSPATQSVIQGDSTTYTVSAAALNGFTGTVSLGVTSGLPAGATASFNPTSIAAGANSTLTIATSSNTPVGSPTLTITGTSGSLTHSANVILNITASASSASAISMDFVGLETTPMASSEVAGVVALGNWNDAAGASRTSPLALVDQNGNPTTATVSWTSDDVWDTSSIGDQAGNLRMMRGYLDNGEMDTTTVTVSGLPANANGYNVYIYADGESNNSSNTGVYQISGAGITTTSATLTYNSDFAGTFTQATASNPVGNYVVLAIPNVASFTLAAIPSTASTSFERAPVNGIQIVPR